MEIIEKSFTCDKDGFKIRGMQYLPSDFEQNRKYPIVILSHGFLGNYTHMADLEEILHRLDMWRVVLVFAAAVWQVSPDRQPAMENRRI